MPPEPLPEGARIGILGGGQLGRMLALAAARLGMRAHVFEPAAEPCAGQVVERVTRAEYDDRAALEAFAASVDVATYEFENVPLAAVDAVAARVPVRPGRRALEVAQDRLAEKEFLRGLGLSVAPYRPVDGPEDLAAGFAALGVPAILKTRRFGYDGKGQVRIEASGPSAPEAWAAVGAAPSVLEGFVSFEREVSVIGARGLDGAVVAFDPGENLHRDGILHSTSVPAAIAPALAQDAVLIAGRILNALDYVGVIGVEIFATETGLVVNEIAPRVHNSGHWTQDACLTDQFEQHVRAICGWPLGDGRRHSDAVMVNLIGEAVASAPGETGAAVHLYGKGAARPGRKMGHVTRIAPRRP
ncbi:MAG TPA: 5-(carboxyamino)imidazole ribonucleotide synthase [Amaricoccus sp.]|uniref:5-(carboxyamino)imidazole ribonucleotide synthase n=1 Tax=Amaricoccus sp. TaxID=1872485 RepID=UPI002CA40DAC|nr:5-(carboxyamino)imidazole ribonucleotide synthase [Amaricoccus sp.]HMQ93343.1 5-(carboxyamino)imidazole ribonucleotide synthase [Amaricoccus sp.]HMR53392.1 5-(carboxyamino)imidazole ribonucleotide synthase [Amaricoccus sp.]HMR60513.1 5-(carboxyamino)imidazole ribonucleotide synthase [Amaricoccus sp.]HMU00292.1 5-(carboxyamino)imidazole ribonucleotide synthase [Amaricoccus sp.]